MKKLLPSILFLAVAINLFAAESGTITDGNSLAQGILVFKKAEAGKNLTCDEEAMMAATVGYLDGFLTNSMLWSKIDKASPVKLPDHGIPIVQLLRVADKYLSDNPGKLHESAGLLVFVAMKESFPNPLFNSQP